MLLARLVGLAIRWLEALSLRVNGGDSSGQVARVRLLNNVCMLFPDSNCLVLVLRILLNVVVRRKYVAVRGRRTWILEDPLVHSYRWLRPHLVLPSLYG